LQILYNNTFTPRPLIKNILSNPTFRRMFLAHMRTIVNENLKNNFYYTRGLEIQNIIDHDVKNDTNKFYSYVDFINNMDTTTGSTSNQFPGLKDLMSARVLYLDAYSGFQGAPSVSEIRYSPSIPDMGQEVIITAKVIDADDVFLAYRCSSNDIFLEINMFDDGQHNDGIAGDHTYGANITSSGHTIQYYFYAENDSAGVFSPERAAFEYYTLQPRINSGDIVINEFSDQWIEFYNNTSEDFNLHNLCLSDDPQNIFNWTFPDTIIKAKSFLIAWESDKMKNESLLTNFKLSSSGGQLVFAYDKKYIIDEVIYNSSETYKTIGRYPNGVGGFSYMQPSFSKLNYISINNVDADFLLYPNPAEDIIYLEVKNVTYPLTIELFNMRGQKIYTFQYNYPSNDNSLFSTSLDIASFNKGMYLIRLIFNDKTVTKKFIKY
jgi:hypothetical protein